MSAPRNAPQRAGGLIFASAFVAFAVFLLSQLGSEAKFSATGSLFKQPAFWPAVGVLGMTAFGALHWLGEWTRRTRGSWTESLNWLRALEYLVWFMAYVKLVPLSGYLPTTIAFTLLLALRSGYRDRKTLLLAAAVGLAIVVIFKTLLAVKIPGAAVYEYLPDALRNLMIVYL